ncbi:MAG TPA: WG repeat-containing protein, partial [Thermoanaerobacterales bacterium]|nr:WG repeat-containing protein [Thermoanaerobacterales bacterium]
VEIDGKWGYIDKTGEVVIPLKYSKAYNSQEGMLLVEDDTGRRGYIKNPLVSNEEVIP